MSQEISNFLLSKGTLGFLCLLLLLALGAIFKTWRDDTKAFNAERAALYKEARTYETENLKMIVGMSDELKSVLMDIKTSLALLMSQKS